ncbi:MAG: hypothetical protein UD936_00380 [Acutalibacteraceae bacterium]|nr:hypothetical protein [Acutalibacteraceae bacterium]
MKTQNKPLNAMCIIALILAGVLFGLWWGKWICDFILTDYTKKMLTMLSEKSEFKASEVFDFEFDRAYVFLDDEYYYDGESFAKEHNLDISIEEVYTGDQEGIRRIVFVDEKGDFVYCFSFWISDLELSEYGMIIYPDTIIKRYDEAPEGEVMFEICSDDYF